MPDPDGPAVLVGTVALDFLHPGPLGAALPPPLLRWGGVMNNVGCALGARGLRPVLVTTDYRGELRPAVAAHLAGNGVTWRPVRVRTPLPVFHAQLVDGSVTDSHFLGRDSLDLLARDVLAERFATLPPAAALVAGTDSTEETLSWLAGTAAAKGVPFWLVSTDPTEVRKLRPPGGAADLVALNRHELCLWAGEDLPRRADVLRAARRVPAPGGHCLVTLGARGALLVPGPRRAEEVVFCPAAAAGETVLAVGAGDVLLACLLAARLAGTGWRPALAEAAGLTAAYLRALAEGEPAYDRLRPGQS